jgi:DNA mismatch endonuclease, patch repair protein
MDNLTKEQRRYCMSKIRSRNTKPEIAFRKILWNLGYKGYRKNANLSGKPDLYYPKTDLAVFIDGCFWHKCPKCYIKPKSNHRYWDKKIKNNISRDIEVNRKLYNDGITVIRFWEHEIKKQLPDSVERFIRSYEKNKNKNN